MTPTAVSRVCGLLPPLALVLATGARAATAGSGGALELEEVVVTAEKRETTLQQTPQAIAVLDASELTRASVTQVQSLQMLVPNLTIKRSGSRNDYSIRGVSAQVTLPADQPSTAMILDGIYSQAANAGAGAFLDVARVEVLKGPQGTLFGRNATAGAISVLTQDPKFDTSGSLSADVGNFSKVSASAVVNVALTDASALRAAFQTARHDGYYADGFDDEDTQSGRVKFLLAPSERLSLLLSGSYAHQQGKGSGSVPVNNTTGKGYTADVWAGPTAAANQALLPAFNGHYGADAQLDNVNKALGAKVEWKFNKAKLTTLGSYASADRQDVQQDYSAAALKSLEKSLEVQLASDNDQTRSTWLLGAYFYDQSMTGNSFGAVRGIASVINGPSVSSGNPGGFNPQQIVGGSLTSNIHTGTENYALFTQETWAVVDSVRLTAGVRAHHETATRGAQTSTDYVGGVATPSRLSLATEKSWTATTWKLGVDVDVAPASMAYMTVSTGWKGGAPSQWLPPYDEQKPERLTAYVLGLKNRFLQQRLQINGEVFYWDYRDRQISFTADPVYDKNGVRQTLFGTPGALVSGNAVKSHVQGADLDLAYLLTAADTVSFNVEYLDKAVHDDIGRQVISGCAADCRMTDAPKWSGTLSYRHAQDLGEHGKVTFDLSSKLQSSTQLALGTATAARMQSGYTLTNLGVGYSPVGDRWSVRGYVSNVEDKKIKNSLSEPFGASYSLASYMPPRTYGLQLRAEF